MREVAHCGWRAGKLMAVANVQLYLKLMTEMAAGTKVGTC
jgi:hypothetical protein